MKKSLENKLFKDYPKIFRKKDLPMSQTCLCWGVATGDGWYMLIDSLCNYLQFDIDRNGEPQIEADQVKEKYGSLCFYTGGTDRQRGMIAFASYLSAFICEDCGSTDNVTQTKGYITSLCKSCMKKYPKERKPKFRLKTFIFYKFSKLIKGK